MQVGSRGTSPLNVFHIDTLSVVFVNTAPDTNAWSNRKWIQNKLGALIVAQIKLGSKVAMATLSVPNVPL